MQTHYELFSNPQVPGAYGYTATSDTGLQVRQQWTPGASGFIPMSAGEATAFAVALITEWELSAS